jgi:hypothetical protein
LVKQKTQKNKKQKTKNKKQKIIKDTTRSSDSMEGMIAILVHRQNLTRVK